MAIEMQEVLQLCFDRGASDLHLKVGQQVDLEGLTAWLVEQNFHHRESVEMPGEFSILASAMNHTGESLSRIVSVAAKTAEEVSSSAHDLASVSEQISLSASQMPVA